MVQSSAGATCVVASCNYSMSILYPYCTVFILTETIPIADVDRVIDLFHDKRRNKNVNSPTFPPYDSIGVMGHTIESTNAVEARMV